MLVMHLINADRVISRPLAIIQTLAKRKCPVMHRRPDRQGILVGAGVHYRPGVALGFRPPTTPNFSARIIIPPHLPRKEPSKVAPASLPASGEQIFRQSSAHRRTQKVGEGYISLIPRSFCPRPKK